MDLLGYESSFLTINLGSMFFLISLTVMGLLFVVILTPMNKIPALK